MKALQRCVWVVGILLSVSSVWAAEVTDRFRLSPIQVEPGFSGNFIKDSTVLLPGQVRAEFSGMAFPHFQGIEIREYDVIGSFGLFENFELGVDVPFATLVPDDSQQKDGWEDVSAYAKYKLLKLEHFDLTAGFEAQVNTSKDGPSVPCDGPRGTCNFGVGANGYNPFGAFRFHSGSMALGGHLGYELFEDPLGDVLNYDLHTIFAASENLGLRLELSGLEQMEGPSRDILSIAPGIDFMVGVATLRVAGFKGITDDAADWGLGGGIALTFGPPKPAPPPKVAEAPPPPAPTPEPKKKIVLRSVRFDFNLANIRSDAKPVLDEAATTLKEEGGVAVIVDGHTDSVGSDEYNMKLSKRRAEAVRTYLVDHGVAADRIRTEGFGESKPVASNDTDDGRAQNRRVELRVE